MMMNLAITVAALVISPADAEGKFTVEFAPGVRAIYLAGPTAGALHEEHVLQLPQGEVIKVSSFIGWDRGSIGEANLEVNMSGFRVYQRSEHKESPVNYDAWKSEVVGFMAPSGAPLLHLVMDAWMTGPNAHDQGLSTRVEFSIRITMQQRAGH